MNSAVELLCPFASCMLNLIVVHRKSELFYHFVLLFLWGESDKHFNKILHQKKDFLKSKLNIRLRYLLMQLLSERENCLSNRKFERLGEPLDEIVTVFVHTYNVIMPRSIMT